MVNFKEIYHFQGSRGVQHFPGGSNFFPGGSNGLFPIETHITCDFPGGSGPPVPPPLSFHLLRMRASKALASPFIRAYSPEPALLTKVRHQMQV